LGGINPTFGQFVDHYRFSHHPKTTPLSSKFLTDYIAYRLGLPTTVVDPVKAYHASGKWITNRSVFQKVIGVLDRSYERIALHLKYSTSRAKPKPSVSSLISKKTSIAPLLWNFKKYEVLPCIVGTNCYLS
jgi:hypothetical protein